MDGDLRNAVTRIEGMLRHQTKLLELIMSGEDDLKAAIAANSTAITNATSELNSLAAQIVSAAKGDSDADIETLAQQLQAQTAQLNLAVSNATNPAPAATPNTGGAAVAPTTTAAPAATSSTPAPAVAQAAPATPATPAA